MDEAAGVVERYLAASAGTRGVDANDPARFHLYQSAGFQISTRQEAWDKAL